MLQEDGEKKLKKRLRIMNPGYLHVDVKYLLQKSDETRRSYLFAGIDRVTRWVYLDIRSNKKRRLLSISSESSFPHCKILIDNGKEFC